MDPAFKLLLDTKGLWVPAFTGLVARLSATRPGLAIEHTLKEKLKWLKDPQSEKAFFEAFENGVEKYSRKQGRSAAARSAARILTHCVKDDASRVDLADVLDQIFADRMDQELLSSVASRQVVELGDALVPAEKIALELRTLIGDYLRPAFRAHPYFTNQMGFSEVVALLREIRTALSTPEPDLDGLRREYCSKIAEKYDIIPMQGISPKIQNRAIGMRMEDIFIPLKANTDWHAPLYLSDLRNDLVITVTDTSQHYSTSADIVPAKLFSGRSELPDVIFNKSLTYMRRAASEHFTASDIGIDRLLRWPRIVVRGDPGSGKSTLTRYIAWALAKNRTELIGQELSGRVPILIRSIDFGEALEQGKVQSLEEYLAEERGRFASVIKQAIASGNSIVLIDGLDEVSKLALRMRVKERVEDFIADPVFAQNHIVITTRIVGYERSGLTGRFHHFTITELDDDQIRQFIIRWYGAIQREIPGTMSYESESGQLVDAVKGNDSIRRMARNPLLLTIIALIKWQGRALPEQRVLLYDAAAQTLIRSWPLTQRRVEFDELFIREWLAPVALHILSDRTGDLIDEYSLMAELSETMRRLRSMTEIQAKIASHEMLDSISEHSGFLLPRGIDADGRNLYGFLHQTFAEYLAAYYMAGRWEDGELNLAQYAHDPYWREVFLLMAGHLGTQRRAKAGKFIEAVRSLNSSAYEHVVHRDLLLACQILCDGTPAGPARVIESLLSGLLLLWKKTPLYSLQSDIQKVFRKLRGTEYAEVLARLAVDQKLLPFQIVMLATDLGPKFLAAPLVDAMQDKDPAVCLTAAEFVLEQRRSEAIDTAVRLATTQDIGIKSRVVNLLIRCGDPRGTTLLIDLVKTPDLVLSRALESLTGRKDAQVVDAVAAQLQSGDLSTEFNAALLLALWEDPRGVEALTRFAISTDPRISPIIREIIPELRKFSNETLIFFLATPNIELRSFVATELAKRDDPRGIDALIELLDHEDTKRMDFAPALLAERKHPRGLAILRERLSRADKDSRLLAASALAKIGDAQGIEALVGFLSDEDARACLIAVRGLVGQTELPLLEHVVSLIESENVSVRFDALEVLGELKEAGAINFLASLLDDKRPNVRRTVAALLVSREEPEAVEAMRAHLLEFMADESGVANYAYEFLKRHLTPTGELHTLVHSSQAAKGQR